MYMINVVCCHQKLEVFWIMWAFEQKSLDKCDCLHKSPLKNVMVPLVWVSQRIG